MTWKEHLLLTANYFLGLHRSRLYLLSSGTTEIVFSFVLLPALPDKPKLWVCKVNR